MGILIFIAVPPEFVLFYDRRLHNINLDSCPFIDSIEVAGSPFFFLTNPHGGETIHGFDSRVLTDNSNYIRFIGRRG